MDDKAKKVFEILGVKPNVEFEFKEECDDISCFYRIDENLGVFF